MKMRTTTRNEIHSMKALTHLRSTESKAWRIICLNYWALSFRGLMFSSWSCKGWSLSSLQSAVTCSSNTIRRELTGQTHYISSWTKVLNCIKSNQLGTNVCNSYQGLLKSLPMPLCKPSYSWSRIHLSPVKRWKTHHKQDSKTKAVKRKLTRYKLTMKKRKRQKTIRLTRSRWGWWRKLQSFRLYCKNWFTFLLILTMYGKRERSPSYWLLLSLKTFQCIWPDIPTTICWWKYLVSFMLLNSVRLQEAWGQFW